MEEQDKRIGIWGPTGAGKTTYLGALYLELQKEWRIINMTSIGSDTSQLTLNIANTLAAGGFPPATPRERKHYALFLHPTSRKISGKLAPRKFGLSLIEAPGAFTGIDPDPNWDDEVQKYYDELSECDGLMLMIDPDSLTKRGEDMFGIDGGTYFLALQKLFTYLNTDKNGRILPRLAFCMTKADTDYASARIQKIGIGPTIHEIIGEAARDLIHARCLVRPSKKSRVNYFGVSAVGTYTVDGYKRPNIHFSPRENKYQIAKPSERNSTSITAPLEWLLA